MDQLSHLTDVGLAATVWSGVTPNPKDHEIAAGYEQYLASGGDVLIAIGGGSCIDAAKGIAILASNGGHVLDYAGVDRVTRAIPPPADDPDDGRDRRRRVAVLHHHRHRQLGEGDDHGPRARAGHLAHRPDRC